MQKQGKIVIILSESTLEGLVKDLGSFALFAGLLYFNHAYLAGSKLIDVLFIVIVMMILIGRSSKSVFKGSKEQAIKHLTESK